MNSSVCRLCVQKGKSGLVNALLIPDLCNSIKTFFGFEILPTDLSSKNVCKECITYIAEASTYKDRVLYNQESIQKNILLQAQIQSIKIEEDDSDDVIFIENETQATREDINQVTSSQGSPMMFKVKQTARKRTTQLPFEIPPRKPSPKELCPKKLKIIVEPLPENITNGTRITRQGTKQFRRSIQTRTPQRLSTSSSVQKDQRLSTSSSAQKDQRISTSSSAQKDQRLSNLSSVQKHQSSDKRLENQNRESPKRMQNESSNASSPKKSQLGVKIIRTVFSPPKSSSLSHKPMATVNPSDTTKQNIVWSSKSPTSNSPSMAPRRKSLSSNSFEKPPSGIPSTYGGRIFNKVPIPRLKTPVVTFTRTPVPHTLASESGLRTTLLKKDASLRLPNVSQSQMNVVNTVFLNNSSSIMSPTTLVCRPNQGLTITPTSSSMLPVSSVTSMNGHTYAMPYSSTPVSLNMKNPHLASAINQQPQLQCIDNGFNSHSITPNKVKVLSVNELNTRLSSPSVPTTISHEAAFKSQRLPIRISLTKVRNEMTIKLTDSQGNEIKYNKLDESEALAVRSSLLSKESIKQFGQAFQSCQPDAYTLGLLNTLGLTKMSFVAPS